MKIENGNQHPAKMNGFTNLNRHGGSASKTAHTNGFAAANQHTGKTYEGKSGGSHMDGHSSQRYDRNETGGKISSPERHHFDNIKDLDTKNRHDLHRHDQWDAKNLGKGKDRQHYYDNKRNYDYQQGYGNRHGNDHMHGKKLILRGVGHIHKLENFQKLEHPHKLDLRHLDKQKNVFFHRIPSRIRINIKDLDHGKLLLRPIKLHDLRNHQHSITIIKLNVHNVPNFKIGGVNHQNQTAQSSKIKGGTIYGLDEKKMASVLRLLDITMRVKQEAYGRNLDYDKEYEKALKSWVGHFGGEYVPNKNGKSGHGQCEVHKNGFGVGYVHGNVYSSARGHGKSAGHAGYYASKPDFAQFAKFKIGSSKYHGKYYIADKHFGNRHDGRNDIHKGNDDRKAHNDHKTHNDNRGHNGNKDFSGWRKH